MIIVPHKNLASPLPDTTYIDAWWDGGDRNQWLYSSSDYSTPLPANNTYQDYTLWRTRIGGGDAIPSRKDLQRNPGTPLSRNTTSYARKGSSGSYRCRLLCSRYWVGYDYNTFGNKTPWSIIFLVFYDTPPDKNESALIKVTGSGGLAFQINTVFWNGSSFVDRLSVGQYLTQDTGIVTQYGSWRCYAITSPGGSGGSSNLISLYDRGILQYTGSGGGNLDIAATTYNTTTYFHDNGTSMLLNEAIVFRSELSQSQVQAWWYYLRDKYGIT